MHELARRLTHAAGRGWAAEYGVEKTTTPTTDRIDEPILTVAFRA